MAAASSAAPSLQAGGAASGAGGPGRLPALDWMRGWVMVLMAVDHASGQFNGGRVFPDSLWFGPAVGASLDTAQFLTRWITHLCAPTFVFLAGASVALSVERRLAAGRSAREIDRHLVTRGLFIAALDPLWMWLGEGALVIQVLYAIGASLVCMALLRRLPTALLLVLGAGYLALQQPILHALGLYPPTLIGSWDQVGAALLFVPGFLPPLSPWSHLVGEGPTLFIYPLVPWLAILMLGWGFGRYLLAWRSGARPNANPARSLLAAGLLALVAYAVLRWKELGNLGIERWDDEPLRWLQVTKYPPSLCFALSQLGMMALYLSAGFAVAARLRRGPRPNHPLLVFGQTALFFYVLHIHLLALVAHLLPGGKQGFGVASAYVGALGVLVALYPLCRLFRRYKLAHPDGWARYF